MAEKIINISEIPPEGLKDRSVIADWGSERLCVGIFVDKKGQEYADYVIQNNNPDYGWVDLEDDATAFVNLFELPLVELVDGLIKPKANHG